MQAARLTTLITRITINILAFILRSLKDSETSNIHDLYLKNNHLEQLHLLMDRWTSVF
jgi:hypothetical protein